MMARKSLLILLLAMTLFLGGGGSSPAQTVNAAVPAEAGQAAPAPAPAPHVDLPFTQSLFLSPIEIASIQSAMIGKPTGAATTAASAAGQPIPPKRQIRVSGVFYRNADDWIVWMNGKKVTPKTLLPEIVEIHVDSESRVRMKWYDIGLNNILSITLRPHQTYDIVTGVLLPGG